MTGALAKDGAQDQAHAAKAQFVPLTVVDIRRDTRDSVVLTLEPPVEYADEFGFIQGQYLTFRKNFDGEEVRRSYSISAGRDEGVLRVGIKKVDGGWFSTYANDEVKVGDRVEAMRPMGNFHVALLEEGGRNYLAFAGGSGITPMISIAKTVLAREPQSTFSLIYGNRSTASIMFREELDDLKNVFMGRLSITHILESDAADIELFQGRVDKDKCEALFKSWIDIDNADFAFVCGPEPMMMAVSESLKDHGLDHRKIKLELFKSAQRGKPKPQTATPEELAAGEICRATVIMDGVTRSFDMPRTGQSVLEAARLANIEAPYACRSGVCSTCRAKLLAGEVEMEANYALEDYEVERGYVLTCQAHPVTDHVTVDYDQ